MSWTCAYLCSAIVTTYPMNINTLICSSLFSSVQSYFIFYFQSFENGSFYRQKIIGIIIQ